MKAGLSSFRFPSLSRRPGRCVAVDFDAHQFRLVLAEGIGSQPRFRKLVTAPMPEGLDMTSATAIGQALEQALREHGLRGHPIVMAVPRSQAVLKPLQLPPGIAEAELAGMVQLQVEKDLPFRRNEAVIDFTIETPWPASSTPAATDNASETPAGIDVLVAAVQQTVVEHYRLIAQTAGAKLLRLGLRPYANYRCATLCKLGTDSEAIAMLHVTADQTQIDVLGRGALLFSRATTTRIAPDAVAQAQALPIIAAEATRSLRSLRAMDPTADVKRIYISGCTGLEPALAQELIKQLNLPAELFDPTAALELPRDQDNNRFITALGLGIGQLSAQVAPFDFLNPKRPPVQHDPRKVRAALIAVTALLAGGIGIGAGVLHVQSKQQQLDSLRAQLNKLSTDNKRVAELEKRLGAITTWQKSSLNWLDHWGALSGLFPGATDAYVTTIKTTPDGAFTLTLKARNLDTIASISKRLNEFGYEYKPGPAKAADDLYGYGFTADVRITVRKIDKIDLSKLTPAPRPENDSTPEEHTKPPPRRRPNRANPRGGAS